jgi:hypothetical protein
MPVQVTTRTLTTYTVSSYISLYTASDSRFKTNIVLTLTCDLYKIINQMYTNDKDCSIEGHECYQKDYMKID